MVNTELPQKDDSLSISFSKQEVNFRKEMVKQELSEQVIEPLLTTDHRLIEVLDIRLKDGNRGNGRDNRMEKMDRYWEVATPIANPENLKMINEYLLYLKNANKCRGTIICYRRLLQFIFKKIDAHFSTLSSTYIQEWLKKHQDGRKEETIGNYLRMLRYFFNFTVEEGYIEESPLENKRENYYWELYKPLPNAENQKIINEYLLYLKNSNKSKEAILKIRGNLQSLFNDKQDSFKAQTSEATEQWIKEKRKHVKEHSLQNYLYYLRSFYHFCVEKKYISENPIDYHRGKEVRYWEVKVPLMNPENKDRINEYLLSIHLANYSKWTVRAYRDILQNFFKEQKGPYSSISSTEILEWLTQILKRCTAGTVKHRISALNSFYKFCVEEGYMAKTPIKKRWYPRLPQTVPKYLNKEEVAIVRKHIEKDSLRNRVLVEFLLTSGCRVGEVHMLDWSNVDLERRTAMVIGKGQKIRQVNFSIRCGILLERYKESRSDQNPAVFVTHHWNPRRLSSKWMSTILNRMGKKAELSSNLYPHRFRHTFATDLLEKGAQLSFIGDEMGHANLKTTQIYANLPKQKIKVLYRRYMG